MVMDDGLVACTVGYMELSTGFCDLLVWASWVYLRWRIWHRALTPWQFYKSHFSVLLQCLHDLKGWDKDGPVFAT